MDPVIDVAALAATVLGVLGALPQLMRTARTGDPAGLSLTSLACSAVSDIGWVAYSLAMSLSLSAVAAGTLGVVELALAGLLATRQAWPGRPLVLAGLWGVGLTVVSVAGGWPVLGIVLPVAYGLRMAPAVWAAWRCHLPTGIALSSWVSVMVEAVLWGAYGVAHQDRAIVLYAGFGLLAGLAVSCRLVVAADRIRHARAVAAAEPVPVLVPALVAAGDP